MIKINNDRHEEGANISEIDGTSEARIRDTDIFSRVNFHHLATLDEGLGQ